MKRNWYFGMIALILFAALGAAILSSCTQKEEEFSVTFDMNYENPVSRVPPQTVKKGSFAVRPGDPERPDYTFRGWYKEADGITPFEFTKEPINGPTVIFAGWTQAKYYIAGSFTGYAPKAAGFNLNEIKDRPGWLGATVVLTEEQKDPAYGGHFYKITAGTWDKDGSWGASNYELQPPPQAPNGKPDDSIYLKDNGTLKVLFDTASKKIYDDSMIKVYDAPKIVGDFNEAMDRGKNWSTFSGEALSLVDDDGDGVYEASYELPAYTGQGAGYSMLTALSERYEIKEKTSNWMLFEKYKFDGMAPAMDEFSILKPTSPTVYRFSYDSATKVTSATPHLIKLAAPTVYGDFSGWSPDGNGAIPLSDPDKDGSYTGFLKLPAYTGTGKGYQINIALSKINFGGSFGVYEQYKFDGTAGTDRDTSYLKPGSETIYEFSYDSKTKITLVSAGKAGDIVPLEAPTLYGDFCDWIYEGGKALRLEYDEKTGKYYRTVFMPKYEGEGEGFVVLTAISKKLYDDALGIRWGVWEQYKMDGKPAANGDVSYFKNSSPALYLAVYDPNTHETKLIRQ